MRGRLEKRRAKPPPDCTFQPKTGGGGSASAPGGASGAPERLYGDAARRRASRQKAEAAKAARESAGFAPEITPRGRRSSSGRESSGGQKRADALYAHAHALGERLEAQRAAERERPAGCTFSPAISARSRARSASPSSKKAWDRLNDHAAASRARKAERRAASRAAEVDACSFTPYTLARRPPFFFMNSPFLFLFYIK